MELYFGNNAYTINDDILFESFKINEADENVKNPKQQEQVQNQQQQAGKKLPAKNVLQKAVNTVFASKELTQKYINKITNKEDSSANTNETNKLDFEQIINQLNELIEAIANFKIEG